MWPGPFYLWEMSTSSSGLSIAGESVNHYERLPSKFDLVKMTVELKQLMIMMFFRVARDAEVD